MSKIQGIKIKNFKVLKDVVLGRLWSTKNIDALTPMTAVIGKNGVGKSTFFDAFGFLADCLKIGVEEACDARGRSGFERLRSQGENGPIEFEIYYKDEVQGQPVSYKLLIDLDERQRPFVLKESLLYHKPGFEPDKNTDPVLELERGVGTVWIKGFSEGETVVLQDMRKLGVTTLGALRRHPQISAFCQFMEGWYLSYFSPDAARHLPMAGPQKRLNLHGDNLANVVQFMEREYRSRFQSVLDRISQRIPGIHKIDSEKTPDGRLLLRFNDQGFADPFYAPQVSDGTLKLFAYLLLLEDPSPPPFLCIEEPENGLYHKLLEILARELREHAFRGKHGSQIFITTHQPYFVDALDPEEVWVLEKGYDGFSSVFRASERSLVKNMVEEGLPLGGLWYSDYLDER
ncbi:AAA family ATPase [Magnetococcales bacterium HHB-1]